MAMTHFARLSACVGDCVRQDEAGVRQMAAVSLGEYKCALMHTRAVFFSISEHPRQFTQTGESCVETIPLW